MEKENIINNFKMNSDGTVTINGGTFDKVLKIDFDGVGFSWPTVTIKFNVDGDFIVDLPKDNENPGDPVEEEGREALEYQLREFRKEIEEAARRDDEWRARERKYRKETAKLMKIAICAQCVVLALQVVAVVIAVLRLSGATL